jgi:hypothetical protein
LGLDDIIADNSILLIEWERSLNASSASGMWIALARMLNDDKLGGPARSPERNSENERRIRITTA